MLKVYGDDHTAGLFSDEPLDIGKFFEGMVKELSKDSEPENNTKGDNNAN